LKESYTSYPITYIENFTVNNQPCFFQGIIGNRSAIQLSAGLLQYVTIGYLYNFANTNFSVTAWIYLYSSQSEMTIFAQCDVHVVSECMFLRITSMKMQFGFFGPNSDTTGSTSLNTNSWYHVAFVYDYTSQTQIVYLNGLEDGRNTPRSYSGSPSNITIGRARQTTGTYFDGLIDRLSIVNQTMTADEVLEEATLSAYYSFNSSIGMDSGPNQINGSGYNVHLSFGSPYYLQFSTQGINSYFEAKSFLLLGISSHSYSFSFWILLNQPQSGGSIIYITSEDSSCSPMLGFSEKGTIIAPNPNEGTQEIVAAPLPTNTWIHIALTYEYSQNLILYQNGLPIGSIKPSINATSESPVTLTLGYLDSQINCTNSSIVPGMIDGAIDEFRIYSRCLTGADIETLMG